MQQRSALRNLQLRCQTFIRIDRMDLCLRDGMAILEREGFVGRKQGLGTIIYRNVLEVKTRIDLEKEFLDIIAEAGFTPGTNYTTVPGPTHTDWPDAVARMPAIELLLEKIRLLISYAGQTAPLPACPPPVLRQQRSQRLYSFQNSSRRPACGASSGSSKICPACCILSNW